MALPRLVQAGAGITSAGMNFGRDVASPILAPAQQFMAGARNPIGTITNQIGGAPIVGATGNLVRGVASSVAGAAKGITPVSVLGFDKLLSFFKRTEQRALDAAAKSRRNRLVEIEERRERLRRTKAKKVRPKGKGKSKGKSDDDDDDDGIEIDAENIFKGYALWKLFKVAKWGVKAPFRFIKFFFSQIWRALLHPLTSIKNVGKLFLTGSLAKVFGPKAIEATSAKAAAKAVSGAAGKKAVETAAAATARSAAGPGFFRFAIGGLFVGLMAGLASLGSGLSNIMGNAFAKLMPKTALKVGPLQYVAGKAMAFIKSIPKVLGFLLGEVGAWISLRMELLLSKISGSKLMKSLGVTLGKGGFLQRIILPGLKRFFVKGIGGFLLKGITAMVLGIAALPVTTITGGLQAIKNMLAYIFDGDPNTDATILGAIQKLFSGFIEGFSFGMVSSENVESFGSMVWTSFMKPFLDKAAVMMGFEGGIDELATKFWEGFKDTFVTMMAVTWNWMRDNVTTENIVTGIVKGVEAVRNWITELLDLLGSAGMWLIKKIIDLTEGWQHSFKMWILSKVPDMFMPDDIAARWTSENKTYQDNEVTRKKQKDKLYRQQYESGNLGAWDRIMVERAELDYQTAKRLHDEQVADKKAMGWYKMAGTSPEEFRSRTIEGDSGPMILSSSYTDAKQMNVSVVGTDEVTTPGEGAIAQ